MMSASRMFSYRDFGLKEWCLMLAVPVLACAVLARQLYLQESHDLSVWKGGGMGMFASADDQKMRMARVYIVTRNGNRQPIISLSDEQQALRYRALCDPTDTNFMKLGESIYQTVWTSDANGVISHRLLTDGTRTPIKPFRYPVLKASEQHHADERPDWQVEIEYWKLHYDNENREISAHLQKSVTYGKS